MTYLPSGSGEYGGQCHDFVFAIKYASYIDRIASRKLRKTMGKHDFFGILGCLEGAGDAKIWSWNGPGRSRGTFWRPARDFLKNSVQLGAKMGARWAKLGQSWH